MKLWAPVVSMARSGMALSAQFRSGGDCETLHGGAAVAYML